jgi:hypothetical protein
MKTEIKYKVQGWEHRTWNQAVNFAKRINHSVIIVKGKKGLKECEIGYSVDTWKTVKNIISDVELELF